MADIALRRWTGIAGLATFALILVVAPLYFVYLGPPPRDNVLSRSLVGMFQLVALLSFVAGLQALIRRAAPDENGLATALGFFGVVLVAVNFVAIAQEAGRMLGRTDRFDPTLVGSGAEGALVIYGPVGRILTAAFLGAAGAAIVRARVVPAWVGRAAFVLAAMQLAFVGTFFSDTNPAQFFSVNGWHLPILGGLLGCWILCVSVALLRQPRPTPL
jgi:hypothetical protein